MGLDVIEDGGFEFFDGSKSFASDALLGDLGERTFNLIEPGGTRWGEVQVIMGSASEPMMRFGRLMGAVVIQHQMDFETGGNSPIDLVQKAQELLMAMTFADHLACGPSKTSERCL